MERSTYGGIFAEKLRTLFDESKKTQKDLILYIEEQTGKAPTRQAVSMWLRGNSPDIKTIPIIANFFGVTVDYLITDTDIKTTDTNIKAVCEYTGLSEKSIEKIIKLKDEAQCLKMLNCLVEIGFITYLAITLRKIQLAKEIIVRYENIALENLDKGKSPSAAEKTEVIYNKLAVANDRNELTEVLLKVIDSVTSYSSISDELCKEFNDTFRKSQPADAVKARLLGTEILTDDEHEKLIQILFEENDKKDSEDNGKHNPS